MSKFRLFLTAVIFCSYSLSVSGQVKLPKLINDGMVLQREAEVKLWGWASAKEPVSISFLNQEYNTTANSSGEWSVSLKGLKAGGPYTMDITGSNKIQLKDVYIGDVWLASGQSNMELSMGRVEPLYADEIANASNPKLRFFEVPKTYHFEEARQELEAGKWEAVTPENIRQFSAVAYFFAKDLYDQYQVPIGIINSSLGGSPAEAWMSEEALKDFPAHYAEAMQYKNPEYRDSIQKNDTQRIGNWHQKAVQEDIGIPNKWKETNVNTADWNTMEIPGYWVDNELGPKNGVVWFRKTIEIPQELAKQTPKLLMGRIVDADSVFINGSFVGNTTYQYPPRRYSVPADVLKPGKNTISIRITNESGRGGFVTDKPYKLIFDDSEIDLTGEWKYKLGVEMPSLRGQTFIRWKPLGLYNAMINPLTECTLKGVIWYQGESNADSPVEYETLFPALITDWRDQWEQPKLPFLFVQLANFMESRDEPGDSNWARLRDSQLKTLSLPKTGMAVTIDVGEWNDIHPLNKKAVGHRLAQAARKVAYDEKIVSGGPLYESFTRKKDTIVINFREVGRGLVTKDGDKLRQFSIAGEDGKFYWANAEIRGDKVIVYSPKVKNPVAVRYAWADNPEGANLFNKNGFPASPFRTDDWE
ncbi:sialate O-acetylesterase [Salinimicrobium xinjiangense]|uniref:sialate O-acetylesterase n=1 Tax=Salinimicrobium xinjiangense TaxID=438596 RepID=UPI00041AAC79|nr:sialate O-acetylesterase [Salinimicrobium xinjiangense]